MTIKKTGISVHCKSMFLVVDSMCDDLSTLLKELEVVIFRRKQWLETIIFATSYGQAVIVLPSQQQQNIIYNLQVWITIY